MRYLDPEGNHLPLQVNVPFRGNKIFASKYCCYGLSLSRRDDIISLLYMLIHLHDSRLPFCELNKPINIQESQMAHHKIDKTARGYLTNTSKMFLPILEYAYGLGFAKRPDYHRMKFLFREILIKSGNLPHIRFKWCLQNG